MYLVVFVLPHVLANVAFLHLKWRKGKMLGETDDCDDGFRVVPWTANGLERARHTTPSNPRSIQLHECDRGAPLHAARIHSFPTAPTSRYFPLLRAAMLDRREELTAFKREINLAEYALSW